MSYNLAAILFLFLIGLRATLSTSTLSFRENNKIEITRKLLKLAVMLLLEKCFDIKMVLLTSSLIFPYFKGDPIILYNTLYPQIQGNNEILRKIKRV